MVVEFIKNNIGFYLLTALIGLLLAGLVFFLLWRKRQTPGAQSFLLFVSAVAGVFAGGHAMFFIVSLPEFIRDFVPNIHSMDDLFSAIAYCASGMVFYGGLLGALLFAYLYCRANHMDLRANLNHAIVVFPLFHCFGRIGCAFTGCCYGIEYYGPLAIKYTSDYIIHGKNDDIADFTRFPVQPLEALAELIIFVILLVIYLKTEDRYPLTPIYLLTYSVVRFTDEFLRGDAIRGIWGPFSTSQWISLAILAVTVIYLIVKRKHLKRV
ncbi:MAG: prolipoprotein diacylglyceryl transferase [Parasporobacterium sp.]|nr:prolipoprotein diacylglyceryl transferase [Parasporobacterium sp.]